MTSPRTYDALGVSMAVSSVADAIPLRFIANVLDDIDFPQRYRWIFPPIKAAAAIGLFAMRWSPALTRLTTAMLTLYFVLAVAFHVKSRDFSLAALAAATFAGVFAVLTARGPAAA
jgi:DoxX-like family